jgi:hypothetical protein
MDSVNLLPILKDLAHTSADVELHKINTKKQNQKYVFLCGYVLFTTKVINSSDIYLFYKLKICA